MSNDLDIRRRRAVYRASHRGTKEMDWLLGRFAAARLEAMGEAELTAFEALIDAPDPELQRWIMDGASVPEDRFAAQIAELRAFFKLAAA